MFRRAPAITHLERLIAHLGWADGRVLESLRPAAVPEPALLVRYRNGAGQEFTSTVEDILLRLCLHGAYHRGQIAWALRPSGVTPAATDFIAFIRGAPAATRGATPGS